jgi:uncharacterized protein (TIGR02246 family)
MTSRPASRIVTLTLLALAGVALASRPWRGAAGAQNHPRPDAAAGRPSGAGEETAIRAFDDAFVKSYNEGNARALAAMFTEDAEVFEADGARYRGRGLIERRFNESFAADKGARIALEIEAIRFLTPDVAKEEGRSVVTPAKGAAVPRYYTVLFVRRDGRWLMASVREELESLIRPKDRLQELAWMVGEWVDEGTDAEIRVNCRWSEDGNFLLRKFTVKRAGKRVMTVSQLVGWDPVAREFRSWEFDSEGGFGEGHWSRDGNRWVVKESGVRPEGVTASATRVTVQVRPDLVQWKLFDRVVGGESVPGEEGSALTRMPPAPRLGAGGEPATTPSNRAPASENTQRRAR